MTRPILACIILAMACFDTPERDDAELVASPTTLLRRPWDKSTYVIVVSYRPEHSNAASE